MATISLRAYNREIESLIDGNQIEEAGAHCRHILATFPKHIDTYRLLGKTFLESQRYGDAADILQRVLSAVPEDFVAHVGMSIIREDEGNLDEAIWHMERAFEMQPANSAIQDELRRLYGRRDGMEPPKVRLTRGALARMYAKGELYDQAAVEIRAALAEDPLRVDLQLLLAQIYLLIGNKVEASEICSAVLRKLPYCYDANRLIASVLEGTEREQDRRTCMQRMAALNPYAAFVDAKHPTPEQVADGAVMLQKLDWQPGAPQSRGPVQPEWAASLGVDLGDMTPEQERLPDWLAAAGTGPDAPTGKTLSASPFTGGEEDLGQNATQMSSEDEIPDWMQAAGWGPSTGSFQEGPVDFDPGETPEEEPDAGGLAAAEIPDWLRTMAPPDLQDTGSSTEDEDLQAWLQAGSDEADLATGTASADDLPSWISGEESSSGKAPASGPGELPDWMQTLEEESGTDHVEAPYEQPLGTAGLPDWLKVGGITAGAAAAGLAAAGFGEEDESGEFPEDQQVEPDAEAQIDEFPDWLQELTPAETEEKDPDLPDWLAGMGEEGSGETPGGVEEQPLGTAGLPDWLKVGGITAGAAAAGLAAAGYQAEEESESQQGEGEPAAEPGDLPPWLQSLAPVEASSQSGYGEEPQEPDWMGDMTTDDTEPGQLGEPGQPDEFEDIPDWLKDMAPADTEGEPAEFEQVAEPFEDQTESTPAASETLLEEQGILYDPDDPNAAFAWLESLAAKQGAREDELLLKPEDRQEAPPEWVLETTEAQAQPIAAAEDLLDESVPAEARSEWHPEEAPFEETSFEAEAVGTPGAAESAAVESLEPSDEQPGELFDPNDPNAAFAWLEALAAKQGAREDELLLKPEDRQEAPPEWVREAAESQSDQVETGLDDLVEIEPEAETEAPLPMPDWLRDMEAEPLDIDSSAETVIETPAVEEQAITDEAPEPADIPDWLKEAMGSPEIEGQLEEAAEAGAVDAEAELEEAALPGEIPDWLQSAAVTDLTVDEDAIHEDQVPVAAWDVPDWLSEVGSDEEPEAELEAEIVSAELEIPGWPDSGEEDRAAEPEQAEEPVPVEKEPGTAPGWFAAGAAAVGAGLMGAFEEKGQEELPDYLIGQEIIEGDTKPVRVGLASQPPAIEPEPAEEVTAALESEVEEVEEAEIEIEVEEETSEFEAESGDLATVVAAGAAAGTFYDPDAEDLTFAWLESLAAKQGAREDELLLKPEDRQETPPEWIREAAEAQPDTVSEPFAEMAEVDEPEAVTEPTEAGEPAPELAESPEIEPKTELDAAALAAGAALAGLAAEELLSETEVEEWQPEAETGLAEAPGEEPALSFEAEPELPEPEIPEWVLAEEEPETGELVPPGGPDELEEPVPDLPDWLAGVEEGPSLVTADETLIMPTQLETVDVNHASLAELERVPGIGFILAQAIVAHRERVGLYRNVNDLLDVEGVNQATLEDVRDYLTVVAPAEPEPEPETSFVPFTPAREDRPEELNTAYELLRSNDFEAAAEAYLAYIRQRVHLETIIGDLESTLERKPEEVYLWQTLGDAYMRNDQLQDALEAYTRAEQLLR